MMNMKTGNRKRPVKRKAYAICAATLAVAAVWFGWHSWNLYQQKKATEVQLAEAPFQVPVDGGDGTIEYQGKSYERNPSVKAVLCIGVDSSGSLDKKVTGDGGQADGLFLIAHDVARDHVRILMIPRDTMTPITLTDLSGNILGKTEHHITLAYGYGDGREQSCEWTAEAVSELLSGLRIDGYLAMNTTMIPVLNDMVGGVTVTVDVDGMERRDPELVKGTTVTLDGKQAELFVRYRDVNVDNSAITRMSQQRQYMENYLATVRQKAAKDDQLITRLMDTVQTDMITNMPKDQYMEIGLDLINSGQALGENDILTIPGEAVTTEMFDEFHHDPEGTLQMVLELFYRQR